MAAWYNDSWGYRKLLIVDNTKVSGSTDLTDFPILVNRTDTDWKDISNGGKVAKSDGTDILFTDINGKKLDHEIESYTASTGELAAWVRIPTLFSGENTPIYIYYGNPSADDQQNPEGVWDSNYKGVWHLDETSGAHADSTSSNNDSTTVSVTTQGSATGQVDGSDDFDGTNDYVQVDDANSLDITSNFTLEAWVDTGNTPNAKTPLLSKGSYGLEVDGNRPTFHLNDFTNLDQIDNGGLARDIWGDGTYIYLANDTDGLRAYTFDGTTLTNVGSIDDGGNAWGVWGDGTYIYLANGTDGLRAYTFNGTTFTNVGSIDNGGNAYSVWGDGTYIYLANDTDGLRAYTFNGSSFTNVGSIDNGGNAQDVWGDGTYIYLANGTDGLRAYTFNGTTFTNVGSIDNGGNAWGVWGDGTYIYLANRSDGLRAYTFNGSSFTNVGYIFDGRSAGQAFGVWGDGTYIYLANYRDGFRAYTFNGSTFTNVASIDDGAESYNVWGDGTYIYLTNSWEGLIAYNLSNPALLATDQGLDFTHYDQIDNGGNAYSVWGDGTYIYLANDTDGLRAYTFNGSSFTNVGSIDDGGNARGVWGDGTYIYLANYTDGLRAYTFNGSSFTNVGSIDDGGAARGVWGDGTYVYLANEGDGLRAYTFNGSSFTNVGWVDDGGYGFGVWGDGTYVYLANLNDGLRAYTFNGSSFTNVGSIDDGGNAYGVWGDGTYIYLANQADGLRAYTFNGTTFTNVGQIYNDGYAYSVWGDNTYVYLANDTDGLRAYSLSDTFKHLVTSFDGSTMKLYVNGTEAASQSVSVSPASNSKNFIIGSDSSSSSYFKGTIDEVRVSSTPRSADWIATSYNNQDDPSTFFGTVASEEKGPGPVGWWAFNEGYGTTAQDGTSSNNDGTISSAAWANEDSCLTGKCLQFDGTDDVVTVTNASAIDLDDELAGEVTFQTWIRTNSDGENSVGEIFDKGANTYLRTTNEGSDGYADLEAKLDLATTDATLTITNGITLNTWHHVAMAYTDDGDDEITVYIDGNDRGTSSDGSGAPAADANDLLIGGSSTANFHGFIDEFKIYKEERTAAEIKTDVQRGSALHGVSASFSDDPSYLSEGLVGHWKMDDAGIDAEGETITDASGNGNSGTLYGDNGVGDNGTGMDCTASGKYGTGCDFDGTDDYVDAGNGIVGDLDETSEFTLAAWINPANATDLHAIINTGNPFNTDGAGFTFDYRGELAGDPLRFQINNGSDSAVSPAIPIGDISNEWHHVVAVVDRDGRVTLYLDSSDIGGGDISAEDGGTIGSGSLFISKYMYFDGKIDEVRIYNRALSPFEVRQLFQTGPGPVAYYKMDEGSWTNDCSTDSVFDSSGNANHGDACPNSTGPTGGATGRFGKAGEFDGVDDYVDFSTPSLNTATIGLWLKNKDLSLDGIVDGTGNANLDAYMDSTGAPYFWITNDDESREKIMSSLKLTENVWAYVTFVFGNLKREIYVDGVLGASDYTKTPKSLTVTRIGWINPFYWKGLIDEVKIYNYARTPAQIIEDMNAGHPLPGSPVGSAVGHWKFDSGYGTTAQDTSNNNNDLTLSSASWTTSGKFGHGFTGADNTRLSRTDDPDFDFAATAGLTVSTWFKRNTVSAAEYLIYKENGNEGYTLYMDSDGDIVFGIGDTNSTSFPEESIGGNLSKNYDDNSWHHALAVKDGTSSIRLYVDGIEIASDTSLAVDATLENAGVLYVGDANATDGTDEFLGTIDEVKIYRAALTADQVKVDFNQGKATVMGAVSTASDGSTPSYSSDRSYCIPGDTSTCNPPVAHWKMDENTGTGADAVKDTSGNANHGTMEASMTESDWVSGKHGSALDFDGSDDYINVTDHDSLTLATGTIEAWIYIRSMPAGILDPVIVGKEVGGALSQIDYVLFFDNDNSDKLSLILTSTGSTPFDFHASGYTVSFNEWVHVVALWDGTDINFYVNGIAQSQTYLSGDDAGQDATPGNTAFAVKMAKAEGGSYFDGLIDDVRIYNYARTPAQIAWEYNRGAPIAHYRLDECSGTTAYNSAKNANGDAAGNNGTITIGATGTNTSAGTCSSGTSTEAWNNGTTGKRNASLDFDDTDDYITVTDDNALDLTDGLSISAWVKTGANEADNVIVSKGTSYEMGIDASGNVYWDGVGAQADDGSAKVLTGTWHHVVITNNDTTATYYVDGKQTGTDSAGIDADNATALYIGYDGTNYFDGQIDDVKIFNYALTAEQIRQEYNSGAVRFGP